MSTGLYRPGEFKDNCGFGLISEALQSGKKVFSMPIKGQVEQLSNAHVLNELGLATIAESYDEGVLHDWLERGQPAPRFNPDVACHLAEWIASHCQEGPTALAKRLWQGP